MTAEHRRLEENRTGAAAWLAWGPYLSERQWGTVREDYSAGGDAWDYFPHDQARSRAYRWGEDGIAGISDDRQRLCFALAMWNGVDPILKERMFGLTNGEGNHGEDVKDYWFYLDSTPTHSYLKCLYKYPQREFPYTDLVATNGRRGRDEFEYELIDTGIFDEDRYFDVFVEYAKAAPDDILVEVTAHNRGPDAAILHLLPTLWFRNTWAWSPRRPGAVARARRDRRARACRAPRARRVAALLRRRRRELLFCENETNNERLFGTPNVAGYVKDGINDYVVDGAAGAVNPAGDGTKVAALHKLTLPAGRERPRARAADGRRPARRGAARRRLRPRAGGTAQRGRRVLRDGDRRLARRGRRQRDAPGAGRDALGQAVLRVRRPHAGCASTASTPGRSPATAARRATRPGPTSSPAT